jgi:hypothetical protein
VYCQQEASIAHPSVALFEFKHRILAHIWVDKDGALIGSTAFCKYIFRDEEGLYLKPLEVMPHISMARSSTLSALLRNGFVASFLALSKQSNIGIVLPKML